MPAGNTPLKILYGNKEVAVDLAPATTRAVGMRRRVLFFCLRRKGLAVTPGSRFYAVG